MNNTERVANISFLFQSVSESIALYEQVEKEKGYTPTAGYDISSENSKTSIVRRCVLIREEMMKLIKEMNKT